VEDLCDYYGVIDHGVVLEQGRLEDLVKQAPLVLTGNGPMPAAAMGNHDGTWRWQFPEAERERNLSSLPPGAQILRLERNRIGLEDYFVARVKAFHAAGKRLDGTGAA
jgi:ABC-type multidrug transport system ATPase subunit